VHRRPLQRARGEKGGKQSAEGEGKDKEKILKRTYVEENGSGEEEHAEKAEESERPAGLKLKEHLLRDWKRRGTFS
jgi:hypothetical protein